MGSRVVLESDFPIVARGLSHRVRVSQQMSYILVRGCRHFIQPIEWSQVFDLWHLADEKVLVFCPRTRTVFLVTNFFVPADVGFLFLTAKCMRQHVENKVLPAILAIAYVMSMVFLPA